jgi:hypothetical protein
VTEHDERTRTVQWIGEDAEGVVLSELDISEADFFRLKSGRIAFGRFGEPRRYHGDQARRHLRARIAAIDAELDQMRADYVHWRLREEGYEPDEYADPDDFAIWLELHAEDLLPDDDG